MDSKLRLKKTVYNKEQQDRVVDREFKSFTQPTVELDTDTVEEFFRLYNKLFYEIPATGDTNSHQYILKESSKIVDFEKDTTEVQPLLDEITDLRERLLQANTQLVEVQAEAIENEQN